jgi:hypothetical protein
MITPQVSLVGSGDARPAVDLQRYFMANGYPDPAGAMHRAIILVGEIIRARGTIIATPRASRWSWSWCWVAVLAVAILDKGAAAGATEH